MTGTCRLFHDWSPWGDPQVGRRLNEGQYTGTFMWQQRTCQRCGKAEMTRVFG